MYTYTDEETVSRISDIAPRALSAYFICLHNSDESGKCRFNRNEIINEKVRSWTKFKNDIRQLAFMFLLNFHDLGHEILIEMIPQSDVGEYDNED